MKVQEFIERYNKNPRIDIAKTLEVKPYVGIALKQEMARLVLDNCTTIVNGELHIDSLERYILFSISVIGMHTNLEFAFEDDEQYSPIDDYDALCESGLLVKIIDTFGEDYASCQEILNMMTTDRVNNSMTFEHKVNVFFNTLQSKFNDVVNNLTDDANINELLEVFKNVKLDDENSSADLNALAELSNLFTGK